MKRAIRGTVRYGTLAFVGMLLFGLNGNAYIDPSVMTYVIQAVAGVIIAVGAAGGILFRRFRKKVNDKLGIDENKNKEVESDDIVIDTTEKADK